MLTWKLWGKMKVRYYCGRWRQVQSSGRGSVTRCWIEMKCHQESRTGRMCCSVTGGRTDDQCHLVQWELVALSVLNAEWLHGQASRAWPWSLCLIDHSYPVDWLQAMEIRVPMHYTSVRISLLNSDLDRWLSSDVIECLQVQMYNLRCQFNTYM